MAVRRAQPGETPLARVLDRAVLDAALAAAAVAVVEAAARSRE